MSLRDLFYQVGFNVNDRSLRDADRNVDKLDRNMNRLGRTAEETKKKFADLGSSMMKSLTVPLTALGTLGVKTLAGYDDTMRRVWAVTGATAEQFKELDKTARNIGLSSTYSNKQAAEAMTYLAAAGWDTNQIITSTANILDLAATEGIELGAAADVLSGTMTAFGIQAERAGEAVDMFAKTAAVSNSGVMDLGEALKYVQGSAASAGMTLAETNAILGIFADQSLKGSMAGTTMNRMLTDLQATAGKAGMQIGGKLIKVYDDASGKMRKFGDILQDVEQATKGMTAAQRDANLMNYFTTNSMRGVNAYLAQGSAKYTEYEEAIRNSSGAAAEMSGIMDGGIGGALRRLGAATTGFLTEIGDVLSPYVVKVANWVADIAIAFAKLPDDVQKALVLTGGAVAAAGPATWVYGKWAVWMQGLTNALLIYQTMFNDASNSIGKAFIKPFKLIGNKFKEGTEAAGKFWDGITSGAKRARLAIFAFGRNINPLRSFNPERYGISDADAMGAMGFRERTRAKIGNWFSSIAILAKQKFSKLDAAFPRFTNNKGLNVLLWPFEALYMTLGAINKRAGKLLSIIGKTKAGQFMVTSFNKLLIITGLLTTKFKGLWATFANSKIGKLIIAPFQGLFKVFAPISKAMGSIATKLFPAVRGAAMLFTKLSLIGTVITIIVGTIMLIKRNFDELKQKAGEFANFFRERWLEFGNAIKEPLGQIDAFFSTVISKAKEFFNLGKSGEGGGFLGQLDTGFLAVVDKIFSGLKWLVDGFFNILAKGFQFIPGIMEKVANFFLNLGTIIRAVWSWITTAFSNLWTILSALGVDAFIGKIIALAQNLWGFIQVLWQGITQVASVIWEKMSTIIYILSVVGKIIGIVAGIAIGLFIAAWSLVGNFVLSIVNFLIKVVTFLVQEWWNMFSFVLDFVIGIVGSIAQVFDGLIDFLVGVFTLNWDKVWQGMKKIAVGVANIIIGIINGITDAFTTGINFIIRAINKLPFVDGKFDLITNQFKKESLKIESSSGSDTKKEGFNLDFNKFKIDSVGKSDSLWNKMFGEKAPKADENINTTAPATDTALNNMNDTLGGIGDGVGGVGKGVNNLNDTMKDVGKGIRARRPYEFSQLDESRRITYIETSPSTPAIKSTTHVPTYSPESVISTVTNANGTESLIINNEFSFTITGDGINLDKLEQQVKALVDKNIIPALEAFFSDLRRKRPSLSY